MRTKKKYELNFDSLDPEASLGMTGKKYTAVNNWFAMFLGAAFTGVFYLILYPFYARGGGQMIQMFFHGGAANRSTVPYYTMFLTFWCLAFLLLKWKKLAVQRRALSVQVVPGQFSNYVISRMNARDIITGIHNRVYGSEHFMALWRIECALGNLDNIGHVSEVSAVMNDLAENDANFMESTYTFPKGLIWAIPVLGFIGTVLGLSQAVGGFGAVVASGADLETLKVSLSNVTSGLGIAFETTLIALVAALVIQLLMTLLIQKEEEFLDACSGYCYDNVTSRLRVDEVIPVAVPEQMQ
ncbi:MAG: MotA/TolQ/ExbB proton channel family protein [Victivallales bacterium]|nr:MotA/TolQ/ExbB proton channel family protein [Victivallales bacterium]MBQ6471368.1 MotA/TolQ/ExbB proton channel family protein [Victivallales bacterium]